MTDILFDQPYNMDGRNVFTPRLKHFYFVIPTFDSDEETVEDEMWMFRSMQAEMPQWAVQHIIAREPFYGANQPIYTEEYVVAYFTLDGAGNRVVVTTPFSEFEYRDIAYADVSS